MDITQERLKELLRYDPETGDFDWLCNGDSAGLINDRGYLRIYIEKKTYLSHRLAWLYVHGEFPPETTDHINGIKNDNRIKNLRAVSQGENLKNQKINNTNKSGITGVFWDKKSQKWRAQITVANENKHLGLFIRKDLAVEARKEAEKSFGYHANHGR